MSVCQMGWCLAIVLLLMTVNACNRAEHPINLKPNGVGELRLTAAEQDVVSGLCQLAKDKVKQVDPVQNFMREACPFVRSQAEGIDRRRILRKFQREVLALQIRRVLDEVPPGRTWHDSLEAFLNHAYFASVLIRVMPDPTPTMDDLEFDLQVGQKLWKEMEPPYSSHDGRGVVLSLQLDTWMNSAFYSEGSDFYRYWQKASSVEREHVLAWFVKQGGNVPDWVH